MVQADGSLLLPATRSDLDGLPIGSAAPIEGF